MHVHAVTKAKSSRGPSSSRSSSPNAAAGRANGLLDLQRTAGNKAVGILLQRDPAPPPAKHSASVTVRFSDLGVVEAQSFATSGGNTTPGLGGGQVGATQRKGPSEVTLVIPMTQQSAALERAAEEGRHFDRVVIEFADWKLVMTEVFITGASYGSHEQPALQTVSLSAAAAHVESAADAISGA